MKNRKLSLQRGEVHTILELVSIIFFRLIDLILRSLLSFLKLTIYTTRVSLLIFKFKGCSNYPKNIYLVYPVMGNNLETRIT